MELRPKHNIVENTCTIKITVRYGSSDDESAAVGIQ